MKKVISVLDRVMGSIEKTVLFTSISIMLVVTAIEVLDAKVLHASLMWTSEVNRIMLVWCILSGASVAAGTRNHIGLKFIITDLICVFVCGYIIASGIALVSMQFKLRSVFSITRWPTPVAELAIPVCFTFVLIRILFTIYDSFTRKDGKEGGTPC